MSNLSELISMKDPISSKLRIHASNGALAKLRNVPASAQNGVPYAKPMGLWYGFGRDWIEFCMSHEMMGRISRLHYVDTKKANILKITNRKEIEEFTDKYYLSPLIDWQKVGHDYDGIEIASYQGKLYYDSVKFSWYGDWDIGSGCVWNATMLTVKQIYPKVV